MRPIRGFTNEESLALARTAAEKGRAWLQESGPIYGLRPLAKVNLAQLNINSCARCVLGQLSGVEMDGYNATLGAVLGPVGSGFRAQMEGWEWAADRGFTSDPDEGIGIDHLNQVWRELVKEERTALQAKTP
jgi:hypothetical protein